MNTAPGFQHQNPQQPNSHLLRSKLLPGMIVTVVAAVVALIAAALPFIQASYAGQSESESFFGIAFNGGRTFAGVLYIVAVLFLFLGTLTSYLKPTVGQMNRAGLTSIGGGVIGIVTVLLTMFVFNTEDGETLSEQLSMLSSFGADAGWGFGVWLLLIAFIAGTVGGVLFYINARPFENVLREEQMRLTQNAPYPGQPGQAPGQAAPQQGQYPAQGQQNHPQAQQNQPGFGDPQSGQGGQSSQDQGGWQPNQPPQNQ